MALSFLEEGWGFKFNEKINLLPLNGKMKGQMNRRLGAIMTPVRSLPEEQMSLRTPNKNIFAKYFIVYSNLEYEPRDPKSLASLDHCL